MFCVQAGQTNGYLWQGGLPLGGRPTHSEGGSRTKGGHEGGQHTLDSDGRDWHLWV